MPGPVPLASPTVVMPLYLSKAFTLTIAYQALESTYQNGESQRSTLVSSPQRKWTQTKRLQHTALVALRTLYANQLTQKAFYMYDATDSAFTAFDPTGVSTAGRYTVCFEGQYSEASDLARTEVTFTLRQVA